MAEEIVVNSASHSSTRSNGKTGSSTGFTRNYRRNTHRQLFKVIVNARPERGGFVSANSYSSDGFGFRVLETKILMSKF